MNSNRLIINRILIGHYFLSFIDRVLRQVKDNLFSIQKSALSDQYTIKNELMNCCSIVLEDNSKQLELDRKKQNKKILLIEDDPTIQHLHKEMLLKMQCIVDVAGDSTSAISFLENKYDLILLDIGLPDMNGIKLISIIREGDTQNKYTKIYMLTAVTDPEVKQECLKVGASQVLSKPISFENLYAKVLRIDKD